MNYKQAEAYVTSFTDYEKIPGIAYAAANFDLRRVEDLLHPLGAPHLGTRTIHIAGTKGKGSTAAMTAQILMEAGYKVGLYTSPHLVTIRERIRINNILISEEDFSLLTTEIQPLVEEVNMKDSYGQLTTFEVLTAIAFTYFKRNHVDFQVIEVGLGGRLDATNVARGDICIITSLSLDHTAVLGNTVAKIAKEKAGIIKPGSIVINFPQPKEATDVIERTCRNQGAKLVQVGQDITWHRIGGDITGQSFIVAGNNKTYNLRIPLIGDYQLENATGAVAAIEALISLGNEVSHEAIVRGMKQVHWPGRLQIMNRKPLVVIDGAHNVNSMHRMIDAVRKNFKFGRCFVIFGVSSDKDIPGMAKELAALTQNIFVTSSNHPRAAANSVLADEFFKLGIEVQVIESVSEGIFEALNAAKQTDLILVTGSLFVVGEALRYFKKRIGTEGKNETGYN
jgi:dihydrofolate synthase/folylpolyglutamate synthase